jgi:lipid II:glycine glycyltransferase (peptidoglycan interpeptide bridge formation enzyme)
VWIDLADDQDTLSTKLARNHRRSIAHAQQCGVTAGPKVPDTHSAAEFAKLYAASMLRLGASERWLLPQSYLDNFIDCLAPDRISFFNAERNGELLASALILLSGPTAYHHLIGSSESALRMCASHLLIFELCRWARARGCLRLFLGGGFAPEDGIFRFKAGFSRRRAWLYTSDVVYDPERYRQLCDARKLWDQRQRISSELDDFFPVYRHQKN